MRLIPQNVSFSYRWFNRHFCRRFICSPLPHLTPLFIQKMSCRSKIVYFWIIFICVLNTFHINMQLKWNSNMNSIELDEKIKCIQIYTISFRILHLYIQKLVNTKSQNDKNCIFACEERWADTKTKNMHTKVIFLFYILYGVFVWPKVTHF